MSSVSTCVKTLVSTPESKVTEYFISCHGLDYLSTLCHVSYPNPEPRWPQSVGWGEQWDNPITNDQTSHLHRDPADLNNWNPKSHDGSPQYQWSGLVQPQPPSVCIVLRYGAPTRPGRQLRRVSSSNVSTLSTYVSRFITVPGRGHRTATSSVARNINIRTNNCGLTAHRDLLNIYYDQCIR